MLFDYCEIRLPIDNSFISIGVVYFIYDTLPFEIRIAYNLVDKLIYERVLPPSIYIVINKIVERLKSLRDECGVYEDYGGHLRNIYKFANEIQNDYLGDLSKFILLILNM